MTTTPPMKVYIDPACDIQHTGFYLLGFIELLGSDSIVFSNRHTLGFSHNNDILSAVVESDDAQRQVRLILDFGDSPKYRDSLYEWADVYAKTNIREEDLPRYPKSIPLGRNLPMKSFSTLKTIRLGLSNYLKARHRVKDPKKFLSLYRSMAFRSLPRRQLETRGVSEDSYVHFVCTPWKNDKETNDLRANFMLAVKSVPGITFEGGFAPRADGFDPGYEELRTGPFEPYKVYMAKTQRSLTVFNNPAVKGCHSWKLAEYLCWGKAIISTPLLRMLPAPLEDGVHMLYTDGSLADIAGKVRLLREDIGFRNSLERNARAYYDEYLAPAKVVTRILQRAGLDVGSDPVVDR